MSSWGGLSAHGHDVGMIGGDDQERFRRVDHLHGGEKGRFHGQSLVEGAVGVVVVVRVIDPATCNKQLITADELPVPTVRPHFKCKDAWPDAIRSQLKRVSLRLYNPGTF